MNNNTSILRNRSGDSAIIVKNIKYDSTYNFRVASRNDYFEILFFETGNRGSLIIDFKEYEITNRSVFIITPGRIHLLKQNSEENGTIIQFTKEFLELSILPSKLDWFFKFQTNPKMNFDSIEFEKLHFYFEKLKEVYDSSSILKFQKLQKLFGLILFKILEFIPDEGRLYKKERISQEFMFLAIEKFREIRLVKKYAKLLNTPINKLEKEVKMNYGKSPLKIINELLVIEIKRLLIVGKLSHKEIAFALNFGSQSSYTRFIKAHTGKTPTELKESLDII